MFFLYPFIVRAETLDQFREIHIEPSFKPLLLSHTDFMELGGAEIFVSETGEQILIGIASFAPSDEQMKNHSELVRIGEIKARALVVELIDGVQVSNQRGLESVETTDDKNQTISLESFFQSSKTETKSKIQQLPVIGTWWAKDRNIFYVAVGTTKSKSPIKKEIDAAAPAALKDKNFPEIKGDPFFITLLQTSPILIKNGGVRCFEISDGRKAIVSVASAKINDSRVDAKKIARLKAIRTLIGQKNGVEVSSIETLTDQEVLQISDKVTKRILISEFFSMQEEQISGFIHALPVVVEWEDEKNNRFSLALGRITHMEEK